MHLQLIDWIIIFASLLICFVPPLFFGDRAGSQNSRIRDSKISNVLLTSDAVHRSEGRDLK